MEKNIPQTDITFYNTPNVKAIAKRHKLTLKRASEYDSHIWCCAYITDAGIFKEAPYCGCPEITWHGKDKDVEREA